MNTLTINDVPIAGGNTTVTISRGSAWESYWKWFVKNTAENRPVVVLPELSVWKINGTIIKPNAWFLEF